MAEEKETELSYEELKNAAIQLQMENTKLKQYVMELSKVANAQSRLDYLFKVLEFGHMFSSEFVDTCAAEVVQLMALPKEEVPEETTEAEPVVEAQ